MRFKILYLLMLTCLLMFRSDYASVRPGNKVRHIKIVALTAHCKLGCLWVGKSTPFWLAFDGLVPFYFCVHNTSISHRYLTTPLFADPASLRESTGKDNKKAELHISGSGLRFKWVQLSCHSTVNLHGCFKALGL